MKKRGTTEERNLNRGEKGGKYLGRQRSDENGRKTRERMNRSQRG